MQRSPEAVDDAAFTPMERQILQVLTPEQADVWASDGDSGDIRIPGGETLAEFLARGQRERAAGLTVRPLDACVLFDSRFSTRLTDGARKSFIVRGPSTDYSDAGGSANGCGIPDLKGDVLRTNTARALLLSVSVSDADGVGQLTLWPSQDALPETGLIAFSPANTVNVPSLIVPLCREESVEPCIGGDLSLMTSGANAHVVLTVRGVLVAAEHDDSQVTESGTSGFSEKASTAPFWEQSSTNASNIYYNDGNVGIGTASPNRSLHIDGTFLLRDPVDNGKILRTQPSSNQSFGGGAAHNANMLLVSTPYQNETDGLSRNALVFASPEVWGNEGAYLYSTISQNLRFGVSNNDHRRAEIEIYNNNALDGKILFRTGEWQDPRSEAATDTNVRMMIDKDGHVGIGTTTPQTNLHVESSNIGALISQPLELGGQSNWFDPDYPTVAAKRLSSNGGATLELGNDLGSFYFYASHGGLKIYTPDLKTPFFMTSSGNIGLGTFSPSNKLVVTSDDQIVGEPSAAVTIDAEDTSSIALALRAHLSPGEVQTVMTARGNGKVGIGTKYPEESLHVQGNIKVSGSIVSDNDICIGNCN